MSRELVHLGQRVCKMETWEIKQKDCLGLHSGRACVIRLESLDGAWLEFRREDSVEIQQGQ